MAGERFPIQRVGQERFRRQRLVAGQAPAVLLIHRVGPPTELHVFFAVVGAKEDELPGRRLHAGLVQQRPQRNARPASVAAETVQGTAVARALEPEDELRAGHPSEVIERERHRLLHPSRDSQTERRRVEYGMTVVLCRGELIPRRERTVDHPDVDDAPLRAPFQDDLVGQVGEGHERLALRERRQRPFRDAEDAQSRHREAAFEDVTTRARIRHDSVPFHKRFVVTGVRVWTNVLSRFTRWWCGDMQQRGALRPGRGIATCAGSWCHWRGRGSALSHRARSPPWFHRRFDQGSTRLRRIGVVALARKLLNALWRFVDTGTLPEGAVLKARTDGPRCVRSSQGREAITE